MEKRIFLFRWFLSVGLLFILLGLFTLSFNESAINCLIFGTILIFSSAYYK